MSLGRVAEHVSWLLSNDEDLEMKVDRARWMVLGTVGLLAGIALLPNQGFTGGSVDEAVERTRKQTRMLDDLYKTAIVLIPNITSKATNQPQPSPASCCGRK